MQNADGQTIVTAPTCGSCAVVPSVLRYMQEKKGFTDEHIVKALATGGLIGNLVKQNASISGAECGCQAEVGTACAMAAAALAELFEMGVMGKSCPFKGLEVYGERKITVINDEIVSI